MTDRQIEINRLLRSLPLECTKEITPASKENIAIFKKKAEEKNIQEGVIDQLVDLYIIADNFMYEVILGFHSCTDDIIFEWWQHGELWIGQRDFNTLRWANGKFCLGDAGSISYSEENEYESLLDLIEGCIKEILDSTS